MLMKPILSCRNSRTLVAILQKSCASSKVGFYGNVLLLNVKTLHSTVRLSANDRLSSLLLQMDSKSAHVPNMKAARLARKEKTQNYPAGNISLKVLGTGAEGSPAALYMFADQNRYLFNCGEGTQRLAHEHRQKLGKLEHIFLTSKSWNRIGGLPGIALTVQDIGLPTLTLHGPPGLDEIFTAARRFVMLKELRIETAVCTDDGYYEDHIMKVEYVPIFSDREKSGTDPSKSSELDAYDLSGADKDIDYYSNVTDSKGGKRKVEVVRIGDEGVKKPKYDASSEPVGTEADKRGCVMCYICVPKRKLGKLLIEKCVQLGVPAGPLLGKLKAGEDVTLPSGKIVRASDVCGPDDEDIPFAIVDCPTDDYLDPLVTHKKWESVQHSPSNSTPVRLVVHFSPKKMLLNPKYQDWMQKFGPATEHLLLNDACLSYGSEAVHRLQTQLNTVDDRIFPLLYQQNERTRLPKVHEEEEPALKSYKHSTDNPAVFDRIPAAGDILAIENCKIVIGEPLAKFCLRPMQGMNTTEVVSLCPEDYVSELNDTESYQSALTEMKKQIPHLNLPANVPDHPRIVFLGTGSCIPNKGRNVSGICLEIDEDTRFLFDCGEGTCGQLYRFYGPQRVQQILKSIKGIYVSHMHADHHLGLITVLQRRSSAFAQSESTFEPVSLFAPVQIIRWLHLFDMNFEQVSHLYNLVPNAGLLSGYEGPNTVSNKEEVFRRLKLNRVETCYVRHCANSFGVLLELNSGFKICYSGDTMPCDAFVTLGKNSDICIHEATMEDELAHEAKIKQHCTTSQALEIGAKMETKFLLLTHFSQRYAKVPKIDAGLAPNVGIAFDNMMVSLRDLKKIPIMYPVFKAMFADHFEEMEAKTMKKLRQKERIENAANMISNANN